MLYSMALSRSLLECGHDEDRDDEVCSYCASDGKLQPALYFCFDCGVYGKFICGKCLKDHNKFVNNHEVEKIGNQSTSKRAQDNDLKLKSLQHSIEELQKENAALLADLKHVKRENKTLSKELNECKEASTLEKAKFGMKTKIKEYERDTKRKESKLIIKGKDDTHTGYSRQGEIADRKLHSDDVRTIENKPMVVAIEIGNTGSCCAYAFKHDDESIRRCIYAIDRWYCESGEIKVSIENRSVVLFDENKKFHSFGFEAEEAYVKLAENGEHTKWFYFKNLTMKLRGSDITRDFEIDDDKGRKMKAIEVFGAVIRYLKDHLLDLLKTRGKDVQNNDIHWVLTVPAIWTDSAKQFMREAAYSADIAETQLTIVTEPEAAIVYYQMEKQIRQLTTADISSPGTKCMVIDLGGSTADFTILERQSDGGLSEIKSATGIACGENMVIEEFHELLRNITGDTVYQKWIDEYAVHQTDLQNDIEIKTRTIKADTTGKVTFQVPVSLLDIFKEINHESTRQAIEKSQYKGRIIWLADKIRIDADIVKNLFKPCTDRIVDHVQHLLKEPDVQGTSIFLMVGKSPIVQEAIIKAFPIVNVIIPKEPDLAVLKGAVIYGHQH